MSSRLNWQGPQVLAEIARKAADALTEFDLRVEAAAKQELYPGHGKITGNLQRGIQGAPGRIEGSKVRGKVGVKGVRYAKKLHRRYRYILNGFDNEKGGFKAILKKHMER